MTEAQLLRLLEELRAMQSENEWVEFKKAERNFDFDDLGKYFSALSNEANLKGQSLAWLVFGVEDRTHSIVGSQYRQETGALQRLKHEVSNHITQQISFAEIYELLLPEGRVVLFAIPAAPRGIPLAWKGHFYGRDGESLVALSLEKLERIRRQAPVDWSAEICEGATLADLVPAAIAKARAEYKEKMSGSSERISATEVDSWDDTTFLNKAKVLAGGRITRTAIILLGSPEAERFLSPAQAKMSWILRDKDNAMIDYVHFAPPLLLNTEALFAKIRNLTYRYLPDNTLFPTEIKQYDSFVIREALHNCIAHQNYELHQRINVVERPDELIFSNAGHFIPGSLKAVLAHDAPQDYYRNPFLVSAMVNLNLIDTAGSGIIRMFKLQRERLFPLPDYDLSDPAQVKVRIIGKVVDEKYTRALIEHRNLSLETVVLLDKVQKQQRLNKDEYKVLKEQRLVEGRYPNIYVGVGVAKATGDKEKYILNRAFDDSHYKDMILAFIEEYGEASRSNLDNLILDKLSDVLSSEQKRNKLRNMLQSMAHNDGTVKNVGGRKNSCWVLTEAGRNRLSTK